MLHPPVFKFMYELDTGGIALMTETSALRRDFEEMFDQIEQALDQEPPSEKIDSIRRLIGLARESLDVDLSHPIEHRDAVLASAQALEAEFGDRAIRIANLIQAQLGNRAFNKCVAHTTGQLKWFRERTNLIKGEDG